MRNTILLVMGLVICSVHSEAHIPELVFSEKILLKDLPYSDLREGPGQIYSGNLLLTEKDKAIVKMGNHSIQVVDLKSGDVETVLDVHELLRTTSEALHEHWGEEYCIPGRESFGRIKPPVYAIRFGWVQEYTKAGTYATMINFVVLDQEENNERDVFFGLLVFDKELEILEIFPVKREDDEPVPSPFMHAGGFFHEGLMFVRHVNNYHQRSYDFVKYKLESDGYYRAQDSMDHWPLALEPLSTKVRHSHVLEKDGGLHLPLGGKMLILEDWTDSGVVRELPLEENQYVISGFPIEGSGWKVAMVVNKRESIRGDDYFPSGGLALINDDYTRLLPQTNHRFRNYYFRSISVLDGKVALLFYDREEKKFAVETYEFNLANRQ